MMHNKLSRHSTLVICPGIHDPQLTQNFLESLGSGETDNSYHHWRENILIFPAYDYPAYSGFHILEFLQTHPNLVETPLIFICFSAGVVGAISAAWGWQMLGGEVKALIAFDGWGVPLYGNFPIHRVSHDYVTHWSSALLGAGEDSFYAEPAIAHLDLWGKPDTCQGWWIHPATTSQSEQRTYTTAAQFVTQQLQLYI